MAEDEIIETEEKKYIPPKTKESLSPAVRRIVEEKDIDISNIEGTGKDGRIAKKGLYYNINQAKIKGKSRPGKGTVTDKALKQSAKTAFKKKKKK